MDLGLFLLAVLVVGGGLLWCHKVPRESDRFAHTFYAWVVIIGLAVALNVVGYFYPGLY